MENNKQVAAKMQMLNLNWILQPFTTSQKRNNKTGVLQVPKTTKQVSYMFRKGTAEPRDSILV